MNNYYKINLNYLDSNIKFIFCKREEYEYEIESESEYIFVDSYINKDDTIIEVIKKICLLIKKNISDFNTIEYEKIVGYLSCSWDYYSEYKILEYLNNISNTENVKIDNNILKKINKSLNYNEINNYDIIKKDVKKYIKELNNNKLVIGYYNVNKKNNYKYYISPEYFNKLVNDNIFLENEYNKPINSICKYDKEFNKIEINEFDFTIIENEFFIYYNNYNLLYNFNNEKENNKLLENIYENINNNLKLINIDKNNYKELIKSENINILSLEIEFFEKINLENLFNNIDLNEKCPINIYIYKNQQRKKEKKYKLYRKENNIPYLQNDILNKIISEKSIFNESHIIFKFIIDNNNFYDVIILENSKVFINLNLKNKIISNIDRSDIIKYLNECMNFLKLKIGNRENINSELELNYLINNNYIKINNVKNDISSEIKFNINLQEFIDKYSIKENIKQILFNYLILFNSYVDINIDIINVLYNKINNSIINTGNSDIILNNKEKINDVYNLKIMNDNINLYYKKSYNSNSYNYLEKYFKYIMTKSGKDKGSLLNCNMNEYRKNKFDDYLLTGNLENSSDIRNDVNVMKLLEYIDNNNNYYCQDILNNVNKSSNINIIINYNNLIITVQNIYSFNELDNIKDFFMNFIKFIYINNKSENILKLTNDLYTIKNNKLYNIYNNLYNIYNYPENINFNEIYIYNIFKNIERIKEKKKNESKEIDLSKLNIETDSESDSDTEDDIEFSFSDDETEESEFYKEKKSEYIEEDINNIENYDNIEDYKIKYNNSNKRELLENYFTKKYNKLCLFDRRPTILNKDLLYNIQKREKNGLINIKGEKTNYFNDLINLEDNEIYIEINNNKLLIKKNTKDLIFYMGRLYIINLKYNNKEQKENFRFIILNGNKESKLEETNIIKEKVIYHYQNNNELISFDEYINNNSDILNYKIEYNHKHSLENIETNLFFGLYDIKKKEIKEIQLLIRKEPLNYLYDHKNYDNNYFVCLPGKGTSSKKITNKFNPKYLNIDNGGVCCFANIKHEIKNIDENLNKSAYDIKTTDLYNNIIFNNEEDYKIPHLKIGKIPKEIYDKITKFLGLENKINEYNKNKILNKQPYRLGLLYNNISHNFIICLLNIIKYENSKILNKYFIFIKKNIYFNDNDIKDELIKIINDKEILNNKKLLKLNDNIYVKDNINNNLEDKEKISDVIREKLSAYIINNYSNLDINFLWNLFSLILKMNIIILEIYYENNLNSSVKCPNINKLVNLEKKNSFCLIFNYQNVYQPIIIQLNKIKYKMIFNFQESDFRNLELLYDKCKLEYNNNMYNNLLLNIIYFDLPFEDFIILDNNDLLNIESYIEFIVEDNNSTKLGLIFKINENDRLFIPINNLKHNIDYNKYFDKNIIYNLEIDDYLHSLEKTQKLLKKFYEIHDNYKLYINEKKIKYITHNEENLEYIIGIQLNIGDFVPIKKELVTDIELDINNKLEGYISYKNNFNINDKIIKDLNNNNVNNIIYYDNFVKYISYILYYLDNTIKIEINNLINNKDINKLNNILYELKSQFNIVDEMNKIELNLKNNYIINNIDKTSDLFNITEEYFELYIKYLIYDLIYNKYKRKIILNNYFNKNLISIDDNKHIKLNDNEIDQFTIDLLYNNIVSDSFYHNLGIKTELNNNNNTSNISTKIINCEKENNMVDIENNIYYYYYFKPLIYNNDLVYSNCIYYHLGKYVLKFKKNYIINTKNNLIEIMNDLIENKEITLIDIINNYTEENKTHIYNMIKTKTDLDKIIQSDNHYLTNYDLLLLSNKYNILFNIYNGNNLLIDEVSYIKSNIIENEVNLLQKNIYNIKLFLYIYNIKKAI